jgi:hypothetical protein
MLRFVLHEYYCRRLAHIGKLLFRKTVQIHSLLSQWSRTANITSLQTAIPHVQRLQAKQAMNFIERLHGDTGIRGYFHQAIEIQRTWGDIKD